MRLLLSESHRAAHPRLHHEGRYHGIIPPTICFFGGGAPGNYSVFTQGNFV